jgi:PAS domain S-box-containing protein
VNLQEFRRILKQTVLVPMAALVVLACVLLWQVTDARRAQRWLDHSDQVSSSLNELERLIFDQANALRGYELTGNQAMLAPYRASAGPIDRYFKTLRQLVSDNPQQIGNLVAIQDRYRLWLGYAQNIVASPQVTVNHGLDNNEIHKQVPGNELLDESLIGAVREATRKMSQTEDHLRSQRLEAAIVLERRELIVIVVGTLTVGVLLGFFALSRLRMVSRAYRTALSDLQQRADELYESREWLHTTLRSIGDAVIVCTADSAVQFMNFVAEELTGWTLRDVENQPLEKVFRIVNEQTRKEVESPVGKVRRLNKVIGLANHTMLLARNGMEYAIDDSAAPIFDKHHNLIGIVLVFRDVTEKKRTEAALVASEKLAVAGRLAASIAHEIHNPLDAVANLHYLMSGETDPARREEYLALAQQELNRTVQISRTMLSLYREPNAPVEVDLRELLQGVLLLLQRRLQNQGITVEQNFAGNFSVEGFPAELRQVFTNLIVNAADATGPNGRIRIEMKGVPAEEFRGAGIVVEITDSGSGIPDQVMSKLFQPFFTTKGEQGTGLGLWVSMGIVQKHGGTLRIQNSHDPELRGAHVRIYLPARTLATPSSRSTAHLN